jgi:enoyl-[acyl-carrier protein] reductase II
MGALALGAAGVSMGTRFLLTQESPLHQTFKDAALDLDVSDTILSDRFDGVNNRVMRTAAAIRAERTWINPFQVFLDSFGIARELRTPYHKLLLQVITAGPSKTLELMRMSQMLKMHTITLTTGDIETGMTASGMSVGLVHDVPSIAELMERIVNEAKAVHARLAGQMADEVKPRAAVA